MEIKKMTATFGCLENETMSLSPGLNIITAPNESGKSTWCAFIRAMLYGFPARARGLQSDKNRYLPWSGAAMQGQMELRSDGADITITRHTARANSPMGSFSALFTGTATPVPGLDAAACGESLLGVSREVFQRSAFIRQSGLFIDQDPELEKRISALITTGEEDTSYSQAYEALKKQLNRRRHNKTGLLPTLEGELFQLEQRIAQSEALEQEMQEAEALTRELKGQEAALQEELAATHRAEAYARRQARQDARLAAEAAAQAEADLRAQLTRDSVPENETIARLRAAIVNLETSRKSAQKARAESDEAASALLMAEKAVSESPFAGETAQSAAKRLSPTPYRFAGRDLAVSLGAGLAVFALISLLFIFIWNSALPGLLLGAAGFAAATAALWRVFRARHLRRERESLVKRFGTEDEAAIAALAEAYAALLTRRDEAQTAAAAAAARAEALYATVSANEQGILLEIRRFAPSAFDVSTADALLRECATRRRALADAAARTEKARMRYELLAQDAPEAEEQTPDAPPPSLRERQTVERELAEVKARRDAATSSFDRLSGQRHTLGSTDALRREAEELRARIETAQREYNAIAMAMTALEAANTTLQNRFSPALGARAAEIFARITGGRYQEVFLNREMDASAREAESPIARAAELLSCGTADELYLAIRLAICELVLPKDTVAPVILDDALVNFDDRRAENALSYLLEEAKTRQILLFTCQGREAAMLAGHPEAAIQTLRG